MTTRHRHSVRAHDDAVWAASWTSDAQRVVSVSADETAKCWTVPPTDAASTPPTESCVLRASSLGVIDVACPSAAAAQSSPHVARLAATSSLDSMIRIWDVESGACVHTIEPGPVESWHLAWSHDGRRLASGSHAGSINVWEIVATEGGIASRKVSVLASGTDNFAMSVAFSPDGRFVASGHHDGRVAVFELIGTDGAAALEGSAPKHVLEAHSAPVRSLAWTRDGRLLTASDDGSSAVYDIGGGGAEQTASLRGHASWVLCVAAHPDGRRCATGGADGSVKLWDIETRECVHTFAKHAAQVWGVAFAPDGERLLSCGDDATLQFFTVPA